jgi:CheY-like chemotaxis protein
VRLATALTGGPVCLRADPGQLEQVLVNLVVNARDAMPDGGRVTVGTEVVELDEVQARRAGAGPGRYGVLTVADTGVGMSPEVQARVFEPFYTTKEPGQGTGLGLSTTYGIVREAGGHIEVISQVGHGTTFRVYLPLAEKPAAPVRTPAGDEEVVMGRGEVILLVEDERDVRELAARVLRAAGYRVLAAPDAEHALRTAAGADRIDLLLTDVVMPGLNGRELAERLSRLRPTLRTLFTSAYARGIIADRGILDRGVAYLEKPYTPATLSRAIRAVLENAPLPLIGPINDGRR